ncbi:MAG: sulfatase-like hydrolase/transferase [Phenylobacterium sp.]|uniref:sulfatase n=1 Tax=Phenylobacterium sp. TaxID=1871053 RepID=UPI0025DB3860|nr:sulfatase [Phenylobacterium sp.]MBI1197990.1 sulfatase-like hydrolase/transferase [Phenylobacterium sp.]
MTRIPAIATMALALTLGASAPQATDAAAPQPRRPNVIVILADDLGYGDTSAYGSPIARTPNIDALAADGVRFTQGYVSHPVCSPSRAGLLTGRYQTRFGWEFNPVGRDRTTGVSRNETFVAQIMKSAGYHTGMVGKWHLGEAAGYQPLDRGFDEFFGVLGGQTSYLTQMAPGDEYYNPPGMEGLLGGGAEATEDQLMTRMRERLPISRGREVVETKGYLTDVFTDEAVRFIDANKDRPFFLYLAYNAPHVPLQAPKKYVDRFRDVSDPGKRVYAAMVSALDDGVGAVRAKLKAEGLEKDTLIIFLSDNGCAGYVNGACSNAPLNGFKATHFEGGVRIPFIMAWPGRIHAGQVDERVVSSLDITPTAAALAGATPPNGSDGVNLIPYVAGDDRRTPNPILFWRAGPSFAVRDGNWKMWEVDKADPAAEITQGVAPSPDGEVAKPSPFGQHVMLYDLARDIGETRNLASSNPAVVDGLKAKAAAWDKGNVPAQLTSRRQSVQVIDGQRLKLYN